MTPAEIRGAGREGIALEIEVFQIWRVPDGKVAVVRILPSERAAFQAVGMAG